MSERSGVVPTRVPYQTASSQTVRDRVVGSADRQEELLTLRPNRAPAELLIREDKLESGRLHDGRHVSQGLAHGVLHLEGAHRLADRKGRRHAIGREARRQRACRGRHGDVAMPDDPYERTGVGPGGTVRTGEFGWKDQYGHNMGGGTPFGEGGGERGTERRRFSEFQSPAPLAQEHSERTRTQAWQGRFSFPQEASKQQR